MSQKGQTRFKNLAANAARFSKCVSDYSDQSCKLYNDKNMITSTQITNTEIFAFIAVPVFKLLSRKVLFINRKNNRNC